LEYFINYYAIIYTHIYIHTTENEPTPWRRGPKKPTATEEVKTFSMTSEIRKFVTVFIGTCHWTVSRTRWSSLYYLKRKLSKAERSRPCVTFRDVLFFFTGEKITEILDSRVAFKPEDRHVSAICDCFYILFVATIHIWKSKNECRPI